MSDGVDPKVLAEAMDGWNEGEFRCRARGVHSWDDYTSFVGPFVIDVHERCRSCKARRNMHGAKSKMRGHWIDPKWYPVSFPDNYRLPPGSGRLSPDQKAEVRFTQMMHRKRLVEVDE
jgi:hypothetical protein